MPKLRIATKLPIFIGTLVLVAQLILGVVAYQKSSGQLADGAQERLRVVTEARITALADFLKIIKDDIQSFAENQQMADAALEFSQAMSFGGKEKGMEKAHKLFVEAEPAPEKRIDILQPDRSRFSETHGRHHPVFRKFMERRGYQDIILVDGEGIVVYTVQKGNDYAIDLETDQWKQTLLGQTFNAVKENAKPGFVFFTDIRPYAPDGGAPAGFVAAPMLDGQNLLGVLLFRMPLGRINAIMRQEAGMGKTGETYIVGEDHLMRSDSRLADKPTTLGIKVGTPQVEKALAGESGMMRSSDYHGEKVLAAFGQVEFLGKKWGVVAEIDLSEILEPVAQTRTFMIVATLVIIAFALGAGILFSRGISGAIANMTGATSELAKGNLAVQVPYRDRPDEIGQMAEAVQVFKDQAVKLKQMAAEQAAQGRRNQRKLKNEMFALTNALDEEVRSAIGIVMQQADAMHEAAVEMSQSVAQVESMAGAAAAASQNAAASVDVVAGAAGELARSIKDIDAEVAKSTQIAHKAVTEAERTNDKVQGLAQAVQKISEVVNLIADIADQTNLLALNATIEAARAGEAGKGFAVVASEVKNLANQTAKATEEIGAQITGVQGATREAVEAIQGIGETIAEINTITTAIAGAIEKQGAATHAISDNASRAAQSTQESSGHIGEVSRNSEQAGGHSREVKESAQEVRERVQQMQVSLESIMRATSEEDRAINELQTVNVAATVTMGQETRTCLLQDVALSGVGILDRRLEIERGQEMTIDIGGLGTFSAIAVAKTESSTHIRLDGDDGLVERLEGFISARAKKS